MIIAAWIVCVTCMFLVRYERDGTMSAYLDALVEGLFFGTIAFAIGLGAGIAANILTL